VRIEAWRRVAKLRHQQWMVRTKNRRIGCETARLRGQIGSWRQAGSYAYQPAFGKGAQAVCMAMSASDSGSRMIVRGDAPGSVGPSPDRSSVFPNLPLAQRPADGGTIVGGARIC